jgi:hypothetical protein
MQFTGFLIINEEKIKVLVQESKTARRLKVRSQGSYGAYLSDESTFLQENKGLFQELKSGKTISL